MTTSHLIQILCLMPPDTEVYLSLDKFPVRKKVPLSAVHDDRPMFDGEFRRNVVLHVDGLDYKPKRKRK